MEPNPYPDRLFKILCLEDIPSDAELMHHTLTQAGYIVDFDTCETEDEFVSLLRNQLYDIILSDFKLNGFDGFAALNLSKEICPEVPFICVSGTVGEEIAAKLIILGAVDYVPKERIDKLPNVIKRALIEGEEKAALKHAEEIIVENNSRLELAMQAANMAWWQMDVDSGNVIFDKRKTDMLGFLPEMFHHYKDFMALVHPEDTEDAMNAMRGHLEGRLLKYETEYRIKINSGEYKWFYDIGSITKKDSNGKPLTVAGLVLDISARKNSESALWDSENKSRSIMENSADAIFICDASGRYIYTNKAVTTLLGYSFEEMQTKTIADITPKDKKEEYYEIFKEILKKGKNFKEIELIKQDGKLVPTDLNAVLLPDGLIYASCRDITERKKFEKLLIQKNKEIKGQNKQYLKLNKNLIELNAELKLSKESAEESDHLKTAFLQNMSHEIRTPMNGILGFAELLNNPGISGEKQSEFINAIEQSGQRMLNIIDDIVNISKIETGQIVLDIKGTYINQLLKDLLIFFNPQAEIKGINLACNCELPDELSRIETDETKLSQVLSNLIKNAIKFTEAGNIDFGYHFNKKELEFYVHDSGLGIAPENQAIVFERFRQIDIAQTHNYDGAGLGLAISKAYVEKLGGKIWVDSELSKGSTFFFTIPYKLNNSNQPEITPIISLSNHLQPLNILLTEDDEISMRLLKELFENENVNLYFAKNGQEALSIVKANPNIQLVLMDLKMNVMDGFEATKLIKKVRPELPVIAQSAFSFSDELNKAKLAGCDDFIRKPVKRELLVSLINKYITNI